METCCAGGGGYPTEKDAAGVRAALSLLLGSHHDTPGVRLDHVKTKRSLGESSPPGLIGSPSVIGPPEHQAYWPSLGVKICT